LQRPRCSRCISKSSLCQYLGQPQQHVTAQKAPNDELLVQHHNAPAGESSQAFPSNDKKAESLPNNLLEIHHPCLVDFSHPGLDPCEGTFGAGSSCGSDTLATGSTAVNTPEFNTPEFGSLGDEWMLSLLPQSNQLDTTPLLAKHSMQVLLRLFRTWPRMIVKEFQLPPIFHHTAIPSQKPLPQLLSNCFTVAKMWDGQVEGSSGMVQETVLKETKTIFSNVSPNSKFIC
jgi:hypothetical protein